MIVKFKKTHPNAVMPKYAKPGDNGLDLTAVEYRYVEDTESPYHEYNLGISVEVPEGYVGFLMPRSSNSKKDLVLGNCIGVLDSSFRGNITARFKEIARRDKHNPEIFNVGDRVCQLVIIPCPHIEVMEVGKLSETERGSGSYGSSGR